MIIYSDTDKTRCAEHHRVLGLCLRQYIPYSTIAVKTFCNRVVTLVGMKEEELKV